MLFSSSSDWHSRHCRGPPLRDSRDRKHMSLYYSPCSWNIVNLCPNLFSCCYFCKGRARGLLQIFFFFNLGLTTTGLLLLVVVRSFFFCQRNREASSGPIEQVDEKETNGWQRLSLANTKPPEGRLEKCLWLCVCLPSYSGYLTGPHLCYCMSL